MKGNVTCGNNKAFEETKTLTVELKPDSEGYDSGTLDHTFVFADRTVDTQIQISRPPFGSRTYAIYANGWIDSNSKKYALSSFGGDSLQLKQLSAFDYWGLGAGYTEDGSYQIDFSIDSIVEIN